MFNTLFHYISVLLKFSSANTQTTIAEQNAIRKWSVNASVAVEIGVFEGVNTCIIAKSIADDGVIYAIDPFLKGRLGFCYGLLITKLGVRRAGLDGKVKLIEKFSTDAASEIPENIDFIFVDGDHSLKGISSDWELYSAKVVKGGVIALHDTQVPEHQSWKSTMDSVGYYNRVIQHDERFEKIESIDSLTILRRI